MKKALFMMSAGALLLASCSNEVPVEVNNGRAIEFRHVMGSRAADITTDNLAKFQAYAYVSGNQYFGPVEFTKTASSTFSSTTSYYWPGDGSTVNFTAFAPSTLGAEVNAGVVSLKDYTVNATIAGQEDFVVGTGSGNKANEATGVELTFEHKLSQIEIKAKSNDAIYDFEISGVKLANIPNKGSFDGTAWTTAADAEKAAYVHTFDAVKLDKDAETGEPNVKLLMGKGNGNTNLILIPQQLTAWNPTPDNTDDNTGAYIAVNLKVTSKNGGVQIFPFTEDGKTSEWAAIPVGTKWEAGKKYTYILDFTNGAGYVEPGQPVDPEEPIFKDPIKFTVVVSGWDGQEPETVEMTTDQKTETAE